MAEFGRDLWRLLGPAGPPWSGCPEQCSDGFGTCPRRETPQSPRSICASGQPPWPKLILSQWKVFPSVQVELSVFQWEPTGSVPLTWHHWRDLALSSSYHPFKHLCTLTRLLLSLLFSSLKSHSFCQPFFISQVPSVFCSPLLSFL